MTRGPVARVVSVAALISLWTIAELPAQPVATGSDKAAELSGQVRERLVGMDAVNRRVASLGTTTLTLQRAMMDVAAVTAGAENLSSPRDLVLVMDAIRRREGLTPASRDAALDILRRPNATSLRAGVPGDVPVASKPGGLDGVRTEIAFVDLKGRPYLMAVMTRFLADEEQGNQELTGMSRVAHRYFDRLARAGREGRLR